MVIGDINVGNLVFSPSSSGNNQLLFDFSVNDGNGFAAATSAFDVDVTSSAALNPTGEGGSNTLAGAGADAIAGGHGEDLIFGGSGYDKIRCDLGDDTIWGSKSDDTITGGPGSDTFVYGADSGDDAITDFDVGDDTLDLNFSRLDDLAAVHAAASHTN